MMDSITFEHIMREIWDEDGEDHGYMVKSTANRLRGTNRINPENACEVLRLVFPEAKVTPSLIDVYPSDSERLTFNVKFNDNSEALIVANQYGIGHAVEWIK